MRERKKRKGEGDRGGEREGVERDSQSQCPVVLLQVTCDTGGSPGNYTVNIAGHSYVCDRAGRVIYIDVKTTNFRRTGSFVCVAYEDVCPVSLA